MLSRSLRQLQDGKIALFWSQERLVALGVSCLLCGQHWQQHPVMQSGPASSPWTLAEHCPHQGHARGTSVWTTSEFSFVKHHVNAAWVSCLTAVVILKDGQSGVKLV